MTDAATTEPVVEELYSTRRACELADVTYRQIDYWCRCHYIGIENEAEGSGSRRRFCDRDVFHAAVLGVASTLGASALQSAVQALRLVDDDASMLHLDDAENPALHVVINLDVVRSQIAERAAS